MRGYSILLRAPSLTDGRVLLAAQTESSRSHVWIPPGRLGLFQVSSRHQRLHITQEDIKVR